MIGYKVAKNDETRVIITLEIPEDALTNMNRSSVAIKETAKYRTNKAKVLKIEDSEGNTYQSAESGFYYTKKLTYKIGEVIVCEDFDMNLEKICSTGIHFFLDRKLAEEYFLHKLVDGLVTYHDNGQKMLEISHVDDKKLIQSWYENGNKEVEYYSVQEQRDGLYNAWYYNGQKRYEINYKIGKEDSLSKGWYSSGEKLFEKNYKNGKLERLQLSWHLNGHKMCEENYKDGWRHGLFKQWDEFGLVTHDIIYENGVEKEVRPIHNDSNLEQLKECVEV